MLGGVDTLVMCCKSAGYVVWPMILLLVMKRWCKSAMTELDSASCFSVYRTICLSLASSSSRVIVLLVITRLR